MHQKLDTRRQMPLVLRQNLTHHKVTDKVRNYIDKYLRYCLGVAIYHFLKTQLIQSNWLKRVNAEIKENNGMLLSGNGWNVVLNQT